MFSANGYALIVGILWRLRRRRKNVLCASMIRDTLSDWNLLHTPVVNKQAE